MVNYPGSLDTSTSLPKAVDGTTPVSSSQYNQTRDAVIAIENELGVLPSATYGTVRNRLDYLESYIIAGGGVQLAQDLGGLATAPLVVGLYGNPILSTTPTLNYVLTWNGLAWEPKAPSIAGGDHNTLGSLQGGTSGEYYHLTSTQHAWLTAGADDGYWGLTKGGTGITSVSTGDIFYASASNTLSKLPIGSEGYVLTSSGGVPAWSTGAISNHNNLLGLQGGEADGYYHLTAGEHQFVVDGYDSGNFIDGYQLTINGSDVVWEPGYYYAMFVGKAGLVGSSTDGYLLQNLSISSTEDFPAFVPPIQSRAAKMIVKMSKAPSEERSVTVTVRKNKSDTVLSVTVSDTSTTGSDLTTLTDPIQAGADITVRVQTSSGAEVEDLSVSLLFFPDNSAF